MLYTYGTQFPLLFFPLSFSPCWGHQLYISPFTNKPKLVPANVYMSKHAYDPKHVSTCLFMLLHVSACCNLSQHVTSCFIVSCLVTASLNMPQRISACLNLPSQVLTCMPPTVYILYVLLLRLHLTSTHHEIQTSIDTITIASISIRSSLGLI